MRVQGTRNLDVLDPSPLTREPPGGLVRMWG
jgi:hypothetical protein